MKAIKNKLVIPERNEDNRKLIGNNQGALFHSQLMGRNSRHKNFVMRSPCARERPLHLTFQLSSLWWLWCPIYPSARPWVQKVDALVIFRQIKIRDELLVSIETHETPHSRSTKSATSTSPLCAIYTSPLYNSSTSSLGIQIVYCLFPPWKNQGRM